MKAYRHTRVARIYNGVISGLLRVGLPIGPMALLTVPGRKTGLPRSTPVALARDGAGWILVAAYGRVDWVKNLQASREAKITMRRRKVRVASTELPLDEAASVLRDSVGSAGPLTMRVVGPYFDAARNSSLDAWQREAVNHPVFRLTEKLAPEDRQKRDPASDRA